MMLMTSLTFQGQCREAFEFYARVLGGEITAAYPYGEGPPDMPVDPKYKDWLMHCWLQAGSQALMGADVPPEFGPHAHERKNGFDVAYHHRDRAECERVFNALAEGGKVGMPFAQTFWSPGFGSLTDRFGVPWMVNTNPELPA
jgi:PhnB protein